MSRFEKELKKRLKNELVDTNPTEELRNRIYLENDITPKKPFIFTFKWSYACIFVLTLMLITVTTFGFANNKKTIVTKSEQYYAMITMDVNPSITMVIDEKNQVLSIHGNNDEGKMIIEGENVIGQDISNVVNKIVSIETQTKYLMENKDNKITLTISSKDNKTSNKVQEKLETSIVNACSDNNVEAEIKVCNGLTINELKEEVKRRNPILTNDKIESLTYDELLNEIKLYQLEVKNLTSIKLEELYVETKRQSMQLTEQELIKNAINGLDSSYQLKIEAYNKLYDSFLETYKNAQDIYEKNFILEDSPYQQMLITLTEKKKELVTKKRLMYKLSIENNVDEYLEVVKEITSLTIECTVLESTLLKIEKSANELYNKVYADVITILNYLREAEAELPTNANYYNFYAVQNTNEKIYIYTNEFLKKFESQHKNDIEYQKQILLLMKEELIDD